MMYVMFHVPGSKSERFHLSIEGGASNLRWGGWDENLFLCKQALTPQNRIAYQVVGEAMRSTG